MASVRVLPPAEAGSPPGPLGAAGAVFERDAGRGEAVADFVGDGEVLVLGGPWRGGRSPAASLWRAGRRRRSAAEPGAARKMPRMLASSLIVVSSDVNLAMVAVSVLPLPSRLASSQKLLVILASSNSSPMAPPVLKSSSIAVMNFARQVAAASRAGSFAGSLKRPRRRSRVVAGLRCVEVFAGDAVVALEEAVERFEADAGFFDRLFAEEDRAAVVRAEEEEADAFAALAL